MDIAARLRRVTAAIDEAISSDSSKFTPKTVPLANGQAFSCVSFGGSSSDEQNHNTLFSVIHNVANLRDNMKRWARQNGAIPGDVDDLVMSSFELQVVLDLSNRDKHGGDARDGGFSGRLPRVVGIARAVELPDGLGPGEHKVFTAELVGSNPGVEFHSGAYVKVDGKVVASDGSAIGSAIAIAETALEACEGVLRRWGVDLSPLPDRNDPDLPPGLDRAGP